MKIKKMISERPKSCKDPELSPYFRVIDELTIIDGMICKNKKILIPPSLQKRAIRLSHRMHQGISKTKELLKNSGEMPFLGPNSYGFINYLDKI